VCHFLHRARVQYATPVHSTTGEVSYESGLRLAHVYDVILRCLATEAAGSYVFVAFSLSCAKTEFLFTAANCNDRYSTYFQLAVAASRHLTIQLATDSNDV